MTVPRITSEDIQTGLRELGLAEGDVVLLHSSLSSFGHVVGGAQTVVSAFLSVLGDRGTLVVPTFGALGVVMDLVKKDPRAVQSVHPIASVAAIGPAAEEICRDHYKAETAHAEDTPYQRIADMGGYVCLAGVDQDRNTTLHTVEATLKMPYLSDRTCTFDIPLGRVRRTFHYFPGPHRDFIGLDRLLRDSGKMRIHRIGNAVLRLIRSRDLIEIGLQVGREDPAFVLCDNPHCEDCVSQRAALRQDRLARESFTLVAASGLAGRYVPQIVENLHACGIRHVELDVIQGLPVHVLGEDQLRAVVHDLRDGGRIIASARCHGVPLRLEEFMDRLADCGIDRLVLPISAEAATHASMAAQRGLNLSLRNTIEPSPMVSRLLTEWQDDGHQVGFTFNAANFARVGEKPFLHSYRQSLHRFVDALDLEDACFDGTPQPLARGNAEIKEMVSILRCASFAGPMTLTAANRSAGDLRDAVAAFETLLDRM
jgi:aminoglycoside 3-N-acetyltransferase